MFEIGKLNIEKTKYDSPIIDGCNNIITKLVVVMEELHKLVYGLKLNQEKMLSFAQNINTEEDIINEFIVLFDKTIMKINSSKIEQNKYVLFFYTINKLLTNLRNYYEVISYIELYKHSTLKDTSTLVLFNHPDYIKFKNSIISHPTYSSLKYKYSEIKELVILSFNELISSTKGIIDNNSDLNKIIAEISNSALVSTLTTKALKNFKILNFIAQYNAIIGSKIDELGLITISGGYKESLGMLIQQYEILQLDFDPTFIDSFRNILTLDDLYKKHNIILDSIIIENKNLKYKSAFIKDQDKLKNWVKAKEFIKYKLDQTKRNNLINQSYESGTKIIDIADNILTQGKSISSCAMTNIKNLKKCFEDEIFNNKLNLTGAQHAINLLTRRQKTFKDTKEYVTVINMLIKYIEKLTKNMTKTVAIQQMNYGKKTVDTINTEIRKKIDELNDLKKNLTDISAENDMFSQTLSSDEFIRNTPFSSISTVIPGNEEEIQTLTLETAKEMLSNKNPVDNPITNMLNTIQRNPINFSGGKSNILHGKIKQKPEKIIKGSGPENNINILNMLKTIKDFESKGKKEEETIKTLEEAYIQLSKDISDEIGTSREEKERKIIQLKIKLDKTKKDQIDIIRGENYGNAFYKNYVNLYIQTILLIIIDLIDFNIKHEIIRINNEIYFSEKLGTNHKARIINAHIEEKSNLQLMIILKKQFTQLYEFAIKNRNSYTLLYEIYIRLTSDTKDIKIEKNIISYKSLSSKEKVLTKKQNYFNTLQSHNNVVLDDDNLKTLIEILNKVVKSNEGNNIASNGFLTDEKNIDAFFVVVADNVFVKNNNDNTYNINANNKNFAETVINGFNLIDSEIDETIIENIYDKNTLWVCFVRFEQVIEKFSIYLINKNNIDLIKILFKERNYENFSQEMNFSFVNQLETNIYKNITNFNDMKFLIPDDVVEIVNKTVKKIVLKTKDGNEIKYVKNGEDAKTIIIDVNLYKLPIINKNINEVFGITENTQKNVLNNVIEELNNSRKLKLAINENIDEYLNSNATLINGINVWINSIFDNINISNEENKFTMETFKVRFEFIKNCFSALNVLSEKILIFEPNYTQKWQINTFNEVKFKINENEIPFYLGLFYDENDAPTESTTAFGSGLLTEKEPIQESQEKEEDLDEKFNKIKQDFQTIYGGRAFKKTFKKGSRK